MDVADLEADEIPAAVDRLPELAQLQERAAWHRLPEQPLGVHLEAAVDVRPSSTARTGHSCQEAAAVLPEQPAHLEAAERSPIIVRPGRGGCRRPGG